MLKKTVIHEIAHAIDIEIRGYSNHDDHWKNVAKQIGHTGERTSKVSNEITEKTYKWLAVCPEHGILGGFIRKPTRGKICRMCHNKVNIIKSEDYVR
jgi:predicted SprT family Zn-dependent metalloprotease